MPDTQQATARPAGSTRVVMLGTGTPRPDPQRCGPATAIVVNDTPYLVDFGAGVIRRATAAYEKGVKALGYGGINITTAFLTHLHSDHTIGYPDLIFTPWTIGRRKPLEVYGPRGLKAMTANVLKAWEIDVETRTNGLRLQNSTGHAVRVHEIGPGVVYQDSNVRVMAFAAQHATADSLSFRFETPDRTIVISGDTSPTQMLVDQSRGCDVLVHEVYSLDDFRRSSPDFQDFRRRYHTSSVELAQIASAARPGLLVLYHRGNRMDGPVTPRMDDILLAEIRKGYAGEVVAAKDLDVF
jgi:ribonuclease BN (tRNA processing enzyme)